MSDFDPDWIEEVPQRPEEIFTIDAGQPDTFFTGLSRLSERGNEQLGDIWYWTERLSQQLPEVESLLGATRHVTRIAAGFIEERGGSFGVIAYTEPPQLLPDAEPRGQFDDDVPSDDEVDRSLLVDGVTFPIVIRAVRRDVHWCTSPEVTGPTVARATCWVVSQQRGYQGWLVPRHAVDPLNALVDFSDGGSGHVVDHFGECIDAVVVDTDVPAAHAHAPSQAVWPIVAGQALLVTDAHLSHVPLNVVDVDLNLGLLRSAIFPVRFSTDWSGAPGQSGSLIVDPNTSEPAGAYLGAITPTLGGGGTSGYAQTCYQLESATGMEFYL